MLDIDIGDTIICRDGSIYTACNKEDVPGGIDNRFVHNYKFVGIRVEYDLTFWCGWYSDGSVTLFGKNDLDITQVIPKKEEPMQAKQPRKHAELIKAWADGADIQFKGHNDEWFDCSEYPPEWVDGGEYRIKPEVKPDVVKFYEVGDDTKSTIYSSKNKWAKSNLKLTFDGDEGKLKTAEVIETE